MGDTGSLSLGGIIVLLAILTKTEIFLIFFGFIFFIEAISVIIEVFSFKTRGKRVFLMSPLHHHYEEKGWREIKVVKYFFIIAAIVTAIGLLLYLF